MDREPFLRDPHARNLSQDLVKSKLTDVEQGDVSTTTLFKPQPTNFFISASIVVITVALSTIVIVFVAVPAYMSYLTWKNDIIVDSVAIVNPTEVGFQSVVTQRFSENCPVSATVQMHNDLVLSWNSPGGGELATLKYSSSLDVSTSTGKLYSTAIISNNTAFTNFNLYAITANSLQWHIKGTGTVSAGVSSSVNIDKVTSLTGFSGFDIPPIVEQVNVTGGSVSEVIISLQATLTSSANIEITFGQELLFDILSKGIYVGYGVIQDAQILRGPFLVRPITHMTYRSDAEKAELMSVLSTYTNGIDAPVTMTNFRNQQPVSWLQPALSTISLTAVFPGMSSTLIQSSVLFAPRNPLNGVDFTIDIFNPQQTTIKVVGMEAEIYYENVEIGKVSIPSGALSITVPSGATVTSPVLHADPHAAGVQQYRDLVQAGFGYVDIHSLTYLNIEDFPSELDVTQKSIPTTVQK